MEPNTNVLPSAFNLIKQTLVFYKNNYKFLMVLGLIPLIVHEFGAILNDTLTFIPQSPIAVASMIIIAIVVVLVSLGLQILFPISLLVSISEIEKGSTSLDLKKVYAKSVGQFFPYLWVSILLMATIFVPTLFLAVPGLILGMYLGFSIYAFIVDDKRGLSALTTSLHYVRGKWWAVLWRVLFAVVLSILAMILLWGLLILITFIPVLGDLEGFITLLSSISIFVVYSVFYPIMIINSFLIYKNLKLLKPAPNVDKDLTVARTWFKVLSIISAVLIPLLIIIGIIVGIIGIVYGVKQNNTDYQYPIERY